MRKFLENQFYNLFLWVPLLMAAGASLYFSLNVLHIIPYAKFFAITTSIILIILLLFVRIPIWLRGIFIFIFGFSYAATFTYILNTPQITHDIRSTQITATVTDIDYTADKTQIYLRTSCGALNIERNCDANVRVTLSSELPTPKIGSYINAIVGLYRPSGADAPATFDYARWAYFNRLTATGFMDSYNIVQSDTRGGMNAIRDYVHNKSNSFLVDALVLGYKKTLDAETKSTWTATGIGHVWSISGFHIALVSGWLFAIFFCVFRLIAPITRRVPARIPAMICTWCGLLFYLLLSGAGVTTCRAFLMTTLVFAAFVVGRNVISLRNICIVFCVMFLINPHYIMQAGFQLSFSAVFGLVWLWCEIKPRMPQNKILRAIYAMLLTTVVATIFTAPFVVAQFHSLPIYGLIGNMILLPVFSIAIMPCVLLGMLCALFGFNALILCAHHIYNFCFDIATRIANLPAATLDIPHISNMAIWLIIIGFASLVFIRCVRPRMNYILFTAFVSVGTAVIMLQPHPVFFTTTDNELVGFSENGKLVFNKSLASNHFFAFDTWKQLNSEETGTPNIRCKHDDGVYLFKAKNFTIIYIQKFVPLQKHLVDLCHDENVDYIVSYFDIDAPTCHAKILHGGFVMYENGKIIRTPSHRPWHSRRR